MMMMIIQKKSNIIRYFKIVLIAIILLIFYNYFMSINVTSRSFASINFKGIDSYRKNPKNIAKLINYDDEQCKIKEFRHSVKVRNKIPILNEYYYGLSNECLNKSHSSINVINRSDNDTNCVTDYSVVIYHIDNNNCEVIVRRLDDLMWNISFNIIIKTYNENNSHNLEMYNNKYEETLIVPPSKLSSCMKLLYQTDLTLYKDMSIYKKQLIPKNIIQTYYSYKPSNEYHANSYKSFVERNPEYEMYFYLDQEDRQLIKKYFPSRVLDAYDALVPKAFRADLFRYCALYILGGCYVDHKIVARRPFRSVINANDELLVTYDVGTFYGVKTTLFNGFMCSKVGDVRLKKLIDDVVNTIERRSYGLSFIGHGDLTVTGPMAMWWSLGKYLNDTIIRFDHNIYKAPHKNYDRRTRYMDFYLYLHNTKDIRPELGWDGIKQIVATKAHKNYYGTVNRESYADLYTHHRLYFDAALYWRQYKYQYVVKELHETVGYNSNIAIDCDGKIMLIIRRPTLLQKIYNFYDIMLKVRYQNMTIKKLNYDTSEEEFLNVNLSAIKMNIQNTINKNECEIYEIYPNYQSSNIKDIHIKNMLCFNSNNKITC